MHLECHQCVGGWVDGWVWVDVGGCGWVWVSGCLRGFGCVGIGGCGYGWVKYAINGEDFKVVN